MNQNNFSDIKWAFVGNPSIAVDFLTVMMQKYACLPTMIICNTDVAVGRKQIMTAPPTVAFGQQHGVPCIQTDNLDDCIEDLRSVDVACVFAFGSILQSHHLTAPAGGCVNIHPSALPLLRGPSPIVSTILADNKDTAVSLIQMNKEMDAGDIIAQVPWNISQWEKWHIHEQQAAELGADLVYNHLPDYLQQTTSPIGQNHALASYCAKYSKSDMQIDLDSHPYLQYRIYCAFEKPFFVSGGQRFVLSLAEWNEKNQTLDMIRVVPAGKKERDFKESDISN